MKTLKATLLVSGTSIGGGILALPVLTGKAGFFPSMIVFFFCWLFMAATGLLLLEVCLWMKGETNIVSMAEKTLGRKGKILAWGIYLFLFYSLTIAYVAGSGSLLSHIFSIPTFLGSVIFVLIFAPFIYSGAKIVGKINIFLMLGLIIFYFIFVLMGISYVDIRLLTHYNLTMMIHTLPIAFTSFAYQGIIPTLVSYLDYDGKKAKKAILLGSFIPFLAYMIWEFLILGVIPLEGEKGLVQALANGENVIPSLIYHINNPYIWFIGQSFAFFAIVTSFLGVTLGLLDFLSDGLVIKKDKKGKWILSFLVFFPPLFFTWIYPNVFLSALDYAGGIGCALLLGLLPILMSWKLRYHLDLQLKARQLFGGKFLLVILLFFVFFEVISEVIHMFI